MKKILACIILLMIPFLCFSDTVYKVNTSHGEKTVVVPEGMTCEDVMLTLAKNYYEISYEYDSTLEDLDSLKSCICQCFFPVPRDKTALSCPVRRRLA